VVETCSSNIFYAIKYCVSTEQFSYLIDLDVIFIGKVPGFMQSFCRCVKTTSPSCITPCMTPHHQPKYNFPFNETFYKVRLKLCACDCSYKILLLDTAVLLLTNKKIICALVIWKICLLEHFQIHLICYKYQRDNYGFFIINMTTVRIDKKATWLPIFTWRD
jgi:hypothetical protein